MRLAETDRDKIIEICKANEIAYCAVFGSFARGEPDASSDIDLLVRFTKPVGWAFYGIADDLQQALGRNVDLATEAMLNKHIRESVLSDLQVIYENANGGLGL
jgi:predicted nucleotidyltransferase